MYRSEIVCPDCHIFMWKSFDRKKRVVYDICEKCRGIWLDGGEFDKILKGQSKTIKRLSRIAKRERKKRGFIVSNITRENVCPVCGTKTLEDRQYGKVLVDKCSTCKGMFFNKKELKYLMERYKGSLFYWFLKKIFNVFC